MKIENILDVFVDNLPKVVGVVADVHQGKSNLIYYTINRLQNKFNANIYTYGLRAYLPDVHPLYSIEKLETVTNGIIFIDEFYTLFELDNRKKTALIEKSLRRIFWSNNMLVLCGLPQNFNKFISGKLSYVIYKQCTLSDFLNGSRVKNLAFSYKGDELGSAVLAVAKDKAIVYDAVTLDYVMVDVPYMPEQDLKKLNPPIMTERKIKAK